MLNNKMDVKEIVLKINSETQTKTVVHTEITKHLKDHQIDGIKFIFENLYEQNSGCILAHCMGLGKTLQVIALLHSVISLNEYSTNRILVLCTVSTIMNWKDEIIRWLAPINDQRKLQIYELEQKDINRKISFLQKWSQCGSNDPAGCLIMSYDTFRNLVNFHSKKENIKKYRESQLREIRQSIEKYLLRSADIVICDEGHKIKNLNAGITIAVNQIKTGLRIILTGTPMQNHLMEYYSMVNFVKPSFLGTKQHFNEYFAEPIKNGQHADSCPTDIKHMKQRSYALNKKLSKIVQRREISLLKDFLPEKFEYVLFVPLTEIQYKLYKYFLAHRGGSIEYKRLFGDYTCLRKIWTHLKVLDNAHQKSIVKKKKTKNCDESGSDDEEDQMGGLESIDNDWWRKVIDKSQLESALSSHKIILLFEILKECKLVGDKCVIFSNFVEVLNVVEYFMNGINQQQNDGNVRSGLQHFVGPWIKNQDYYRLDGNIPKDRRHSMITNFNDDNNKRMKAFLISVDAGGQGINLFGANRLILLDTSWNPSKDQQSIFRVYRMGQQKNCYIYRLLSMGTMEEKIYSRSVTKQAMSCRVVDKQQVDRHYSINELEELYSLSKTNMAERPVPILPKDNLLAQLLQKHPDKIYKYLEHDSLLQNKVEEELSDAEKNEAWQRFERNSQNQSMYASSVESSQQILTSQNSTIGSASKSQSKTASNISEFKKPVAVHMGPQTNSLARSLDTFLETNTIMESCYENSAIPSIDSLAKNEVMEMKEEFSDELMDNRPISEDAYSKTAIPNATNSLITDWRGLDILVQNPEVDANCKKENNSSNELFGSEAVKDELLQKLTDVLVVDDVSVQNAVVDTDSKNAIHSFNEPLESESDTKHEKFSQTDGLVLDDIMVQNPEVGGYSSSEKNSSIEPLRSEEINEEFLQELNEARVLDGVSVENSEVGANESNSAMKPLGSDSDSMNNAFPQTEGRVLDNITIQNPEVVGEEFEEDVSDLENGSNSFNDTLKNDTIEEFSQEATNGRYFKDVLVQNTEVDTDSRNVTQCSNEQLRSANYEEFTQELSDGRVSDISVQNSEVGTLSQSNYLAKPLHITEEFSQVDADFENATNFIIETMGSDFINDAFLGELTGERVFNGFLVVNTEVEADSSAINEEFSQRVTGESVFHDVSVQNTEVGSYAKNEPKSLIKPLQTGGQELSDVLAQNAEVGTDATKTLNETFGNNVVNNESLQRKTFIGPPHILTEKINASTSMVDFQPSIDVAESQESLIAEFEDFEDFDKENVNRTANSLSAFAKGLLNSLNIPYTVPLHQRHPQNVLNTIENYSKDKHIFRNQFNNLEYKLTFKRPLNSNDHRPVKKLKLSLEIDQNASVSVDKVLSTLPFIINDRTLFEGTTHSDEPHEMIRNDNLRIVNKLSNVNTNDLKTTSKVVGLTSEKPKNIAVSRQVVDPMLTSQAEYTSSQAEYTSSQAEYTSSQAEYTSSQAEYTSSQAEYTTNEVKISAYNNQLSQESYLKPSSVQSAPVSANLMNSLGASLAEDLEMKSNCIQTPSITRDNVNDLLRKSFVPGPFIDDEFLKQSDVANNEQESLSQSDTHESVSPTLCNEEHSFEDEPMLPNSPQRSEESYEESEEESVNGTVRHFDAFDNFAGKQNSSSDKTHFETPRIETSSEDELDLENYFESHSTQAVAVYDGSNSSNDHSVLSSIKRACVLM